MKNYLRFLKEFVYKYKKNLIVASMMSMISMGVLLLNPILSKYVVDSIIVNNSKQILNKVLIVIIIAICANSIFHIIYTCILNKTFLLIGYDIKTKFFKHICKLDLLISSKMDNGQMNYRLFNDTEAIKLSFGQLIFGGLFNLFLLISFAIYMMTMNLKLSVFILFVQAFQIILIIMFTPKVKSITFKIKYMYERIMNRTIEVVNSLYLLKACGNEKQEITRFNKTLNDVVDQSYKESKLNLFFTELSSIINLISSFGVIWYGGMLIIDKHLTLGELTSFMIISSMLNAPITSITTVILNMQDVLTSIDRIYEILDTNSSMECENQITPDERLSGNISVKNVCFRYDRKKDILKNINLNFKSNSLNAIVGRSGAGKTTLCLLLGRFFDVTSGSIEIDGYNIRELNGEWIRNNIGVVLQNCFLFSGTIRENILLGKSDATEEEIKQAAVLANANEFIEKLPDGYWTQVGDNGRKLSGGQAQRIAIARIFLQNPSIVILDEATSFIDLESEMYIKGALQKLSQTATVIIITHKLETAKISSNIIVVNDGRIVQQGSHDELIAEEDGIYSNLYKKILN